MFVDDVATQDQKEAIVGAYSGKMGGPLADLAGLIAEVKEVRSAKITHKIVNGVGTLVVDGILEAELEPFRARTARSRRSATASSAPSRGRLRTSRRRRPTRSACPSTGSAGSSATGTRSRPTT